MPPFNISQYLDCIDLNSLKNQFIGQIKNYYLKQRTIDEGILFALFFFFFCNNNIYIYITKKKKNIVMF